MDRANVFVIEDDEGLRYALQHQLAAAGFVVESFASAEEFLEADPASGPGCVVLDLGLPGMDGLELQRRLADDDKPLAVVFLTGIGVVPQAVEAVKQGAVDFLIKPYEDEALFRSVRRAVADAEQRHQLHANKEVCRRRLSRLSPRELEVLGLVVSGSTNKEIARRLGISTKTVEAHRAHVMRKAEADSVVDLIRLVDGPRAEPAGVAVGN